MSQGADDFQPTRTARRTVAAYFAAVTFVVGFSDPTGLIWLPVQFTLKDDFQFSPQRLAVFEAIVLIPASLAFVWGWVRDRWRPKRLGDRAYLFGGCLIALASYLYLASPVGASGYLPLVCGLLLASATFEMMSAAAEAMMTTVSQRYLMTGRISAVDHFAQLVAEVSALIAGGWLASRISTPSVFPIAVVSTTAILPLALWCPPTVQRGLGGTVSTAEHHSSGIRQVLRHKTIWLVVAMNALWSFAPCWGTPLLYHLTSNVGLSTEAFGIYRAVNYASMAGAAVVYAYVCRRQPLGRILYWTIPVNLFAAVLILFMTGPLQANAMGALAGLLTGFGNIALFDLARRTCPPEFAGTGTMLAFSGWTFSSTIGDVFGSWVYEGAGLAVCIGADVLTKALILPVLILLPKTVREHMDGDA